MNYYVCIHCEKTDLSEYMLNFKTYADLQNEWKRGETRSLPFCYICGHSVDGERHRAITLQRWAEIMGDSCSQFEGDEADYLADWGDWEEFIEPFDDDD